MALLKRVHGLGLQNIMGDLSHLALDKAGDFLKIPFLPRLTTAIGNAFETLT
jgi:hypothetical protein